MSKYIYNWSGKGEGYKFIFIASSKSTVLLGWSCLY